MVDARISLEDLYDLTLVTDLALSPDGERVAFVADEFDPEADERRSSLFVAPSDGSEPPHRLTRASDASAPRWSPDGTKLGFLAGRDEDVELAVNPPADDEEGEEDGEDAAAEMTDDEPKPQVWAFDLARGGDARQLTAFDEGARGFDWSPDGSRLVVSARDPTDDQREYLRERREENGPVVTERLQHKFDGQGWLDDVTTYLFVVDAETRERRRLDDAYGGGISVAGGGLQPRWSPDGDRIAFRSTRTERPDDTYAADLYTIAPNGENLRRITDADLTVGSPEWSPDGERIAFAGERPTNWCVPTQVYVASVDDGAYESVSDSLDRTLARVQTLRWRDESTVVAPIGDEGLTRLARFDADGGPAERAFERQGDSRTVTLFDCRDDTVALCLSHPDDAPDVYTMDASGLTAAADDSDPLTRVSTTNEAFAEEYPLPRYRRVTFENEDGDDIEGLAYLPPTFDPDDPEPRPLVASIHGGPLSYDAPEFRFAYAYWANRGYVVLRTNYRGSSSYGREFAETIRGDWGPRESADVVAGVESLVDRGWADPDCAFVTGFSYGGITTANLVTRTDTFAAAAAEHGIYDWRSAFGTDDSHKWAENDFGLPWENPDTYESISSIPDVGNVDTPLLVTAGGQDWRCPPTQAEQLYVSVKKQGVPAKLVVYPDEHHNVGDPDRAIHRLEQLTDWFESHAAVDPAGDDSF